MCIALSSYLGAQDLSETIIDLKCGIGAELTPEQKLEQFEKFKQWRQQRERVIIDEEGNLIGTESSPNQYRIPIVFHIFENVQGTTNTDVQGAVDQLNDAFAHLNAFDMNEGVNTNIQFCLAQKAPDGGITYGINRIASEYSEFDMDLEDLKLKTTLQWDPRYYLNIWVVGGIYSEIGRGFNGRVGWVRVGAGGYATLPGSPTTLGAFRDGIVAQGMDPTLLAHEVGHYLGLLHTFQGGCPNNDCELDGDLVCDTPPDKKTGGFCADNSCGTDTLSNYSNNHFMTDVPDMTSNFMDYSPASCQTDFTLGQRDRMHFSIDSFRSMLGEDACSKPCNSNVLIEYITPGSTTISVNDPVNFTSTTRGGSKYEWYIEKVGGISSNYSTAMPQGYTPTTPVVATTKEITHSFTEEGKYRVYMKMWEGTDPSCFASYSQIVRVTCGGLDARFVPTKRLIASKQPAAKYIDSVYFQNLSQGADSYLWTVTHYPYDPSISTTLPVYTTADEHLNHTFLEPGVYAVQLEAFKGTCSDVVGPYSLYVVDPTMNGVPVIARADCLNQDSIKVQLDIWNVGFDTINVGTPVAFYDADPRSTTTSPNLLTTYQTERPVYGKDFPQTFEVRMKGSMPRLDQLYVVFNHDGAGATPVTFVNNDNNVSSDRSVFPPSGSNELSYDDNFAQRANFQFVVELVTPNDLACAFSDHQIEAKILNDPGGSTIRWIPASDLSCTDCLNPLVSMTDQTVTKEIIVTSSCGCSDSTTVVIDTRPYEAPMVTQPGDACQFSLLADLGGFVTGQDIRWYTAETGGSGTNQTPVLDPDIPGTYDFWVSQTVNGCEGPREKLSMLIKPAPLPVVSVVADICLNEPTPDLLAAVSGTNLRWYSTAFGGVGSATAPTVNTGTAGPVNFWVTQTTNGCESPRVPLSFAIIDLPPIPTVDPLIHFCVDDPDPDLSSFVTGTDLKWYTDFSTGTGNPSPAPLRMDTAGVAKYWVTQALNGCEGPPAEVTFQVNFIDVAYQDFYEVDEGNPLNMEVKVETEPIESNFSVTWKNESGTVVGNGLTTTQYPERTTSYTVEVVTDEGCIEIRQIEVTVIMDLRPAEIFTPNSDGFNDEWNVGFIEQFPEGTISVFNRWGNLVFKSANYQNNWRGVHNNQELPVGTYYYVVDLSAYEREAVTGSVTIMR
ncbi:MAG: T9SS type B sorting domain-containing protein [Roseivirga sp.]|nr:T9SS type B sorting domain-containing protein [Roseivirga sp.]